MTTVLAALVVTQGVFDMGALTNTLSQGAASHSSSGGSVRKKRRRLASPAVLLFTPSKAGRKRVTDGIVGAFKATEPKFAEALRQDFVKHDPVEEMTPDIRKVGLDPRNVADGMALYLVQAWYGIRGRVAGDTPHYRAVSRQIREAMRAVPGVTKISNALKQETGETAILYAGLAESSVKLAQKQPGAMPQVKANLARNAKAMYGFDLSKMRMGPNGLY